VCIFVPVGVRVLVCPCVRAIFCSCTYASGCA